ncbi:MAG: putative RecB family nuclease [Sediminicola sp.]|jgi:predicted RecB family nuclease
MKIDTICEDAVASFSICQRKSYNILFHHSEADEQSYAAFLRERVQETEDSFFLEKQNCLPFHSDNLTGKADFIIDVTLTISDLIVKKIHLQMQEGKSKFGHYTYQPLLFISSNKVNPEDRIRASYVSFVLSKIQEKMPERVTFISVNNSKKSIKISNDIYIPIVNELKRWLKSTPEIPPVTFNKHCPICQYQKNCVKVAEKENSIVLLGNMSPKVMKKFESKGIFTIKQLSYLYKPRRRSNHWGERKPTHQYELQALALRTQNIYTDMLIKLQKSDIEIFIDVESFPEQEFHYLIGILISTPETQDYFALWADEISEERGIWESFLETVNRYPTAPIFHYGSYEKKVIRVLAERYATDIEGIYERLRNVNTYIYGRVYFPTRTNRLKDICGYLGFTWTAKDASGLNSIVLRHNYNKSHAVKIKNHLVKYNQEDCANLKKLKDLLYSICNEDPSQSNVRAIDDKNQLLNPLGGQLVREFDSFVKSAHGIYEQSKISVGKAKSSEAINKTDRNSYDKSIPKSKVDKVVRVARRRVCPLHKLKLLPTTLIAERITTDLVCNSKGLKTVITKYWGYKGRCSRCSHRHNPPRISKSAKAAKYGHGLKAWIAYQRLAMRLPFRKISQLIEDSFNLVISCGTVESLFRSVSVDYIKTEKMTLKLILESSKIHVDETLVSIQGKIQYVWVFTDGTHVVFKLTSTRDSSIVHQILKDYDGVLISDFFAGYDAIDCFQQKCWVHLIRDINDDLRKFPFDSEYEGFVLAIRDLIAPIFEAIKKYGLKKRNLNKFRKSIEKFYKKEVDGITYQSDITKKYQKRFIRYRASLFVFLEHDDIPWNNNMAERALRHLAVQRKISGSFFASGMSNYLLLLGITQTCRFQNKPLLEFLISGEKDLATFTGKKNIRGWRM